MMKILSVLLLGLFVGTSVIPSITGSDSSTDDTIKEIILIEINNANEVNVLGSYDTSILETYDSAVLVEILAKEIPLLVQHGYEVRSLPHRTLIHVRDLVFDVSTGEPDIPSELYRGSYYSDEEGLYLVHMIGPVASGWRPALEDLGVTVLNYVHHYAYKVQMTPEQAEMVMDLYFVDWVGIYHPYYKVERDLEPGLVTIDLVPGASVESLYKMQDDITIISLVETSIGYQLVCYVVSQEIIYELASINEVRSIIKYSEPVLHSEVDSQIIGGGAWIMDDDDNPSTPYRLHGDYGAYINQLGYTGEGVVIAVADTGLGDGTIGDAGHPDFANRVLGGYFWSGSGWQDGHGHGTHCSGSAAGDTYSGTVVTYVGHGPYYVSQGLAYESDLYAVKIFSDGGSWSGPGDDYQIVQVAKQNADAYVHSNSWGSTFPSATYGASDNAYDRAARDADGSTPGNQPMVITVSAGNSGSSYQTISSPGCAKNVITIGATHSYMPDSTSYGNTHNNGNNPDNVVSFSSRGWTADDRVKPDVVAPGQAILSASTPNVAGSNLYGLYTEDSRYEWCSGTSMSNPAVAGAAAVTVQWYELNHESRPSPAMVKALLINTAQNLDDTNGNTGPIPNQDEGWGMVDISKLEYPYDDPVSFYLHDQEHVFTGSVQNEEYLVMSDREGVPLKVSLVWTDKEAPSGTGSGRTLVNDLHLEVESPSGEIYRGNAFSDGWTIAGAETMSVFDYSGDGWDDTNNVENVYIHPGDVEIGIYTVRVIADTIVDDATNAGYNSQDFALVVYNGMEEIPGDPPSITVVSPNGGENWDAYAFESITWNTIEGDDPIHSITLWYSTDNGASWTVIDTGLSDTGLYQWSVPNVHSSQCLIRARVRDTLGRRGEDTSNNVFSILGVPPAAPMDLIVDHVSTPVMKLFDDFSDGTLDDWTIYQGSWDASEGYLQGHGSISTPAFLNGTPLEAYGRWEYDFQLKRTSSAGGERQKIRNHFIQITDADARYSSGYYVLIESYNFLWWTFGSINLWRWDAGSTPSGSIISSSWSPNTNMHTLAIERDETGLFRLYLNDQLLGSGSDNTYTTTEYLGFRHGQNLGGEGDHIIHEIRVEVLGDDDDHNLLTWNASSDDPEEVSEYGIYRSEDYMGPWDTSTRIDTVLADGSDVYVYYDFDKGLADDIYWWYVVRAVGKNGLEEDNINAVNEPGLTNIPPVASFDYEPMNPFVLQIVYFNSTSYDHDGYIVNWTWDMDDGTIVYGEQVTHEFESSTHYEVTLTVTDNGSAVCSVSKTVFVLSGEEIVDIEQDEFDRGFRMMPGWDGYQEFIPSMDMLSRVELYMTKSGSPTGDITVQIREDVASGTLVFEGIISPDNVLTSFPDYVWVSVDLGAVPVTSGQTYVIVLLSPGDGAGTHHNLQWAWCDSYPANSGGPYDGGWFYFRKDFSPGWSFVRDWDFTFKTYGYE